ncbi:DinB family protein [Streptacidiphilus sp. PB12-B1b]|uniref:DinB family protein n=1 Tax=Streptacidiphilus sp. PB12-B1b TaxID=2705012 RepID=UPI0015FCFCF1|nr:DinB family protein [Streptacidiphilus sp. PB12-B1b]QMU79762.1 DinB family protein [Streptacidiphilus sp. PB12-B1b]
MQDHQRNEPPLQADERATLTAFLQYHRETLEWKCTGLTPAQLRERAVPPSSLSLLGLVRHLAEVERSWFQMVLLGEQVERHWPRGDTDGGVFDVESADPDQAFTLWQAACARSRAIVDAAESLDATGSHGEEVFSLRWILTHMIEEYARHNGHADLLRERLDGATGE